MQGLVTAGVRLLCRSDNRDCRQQADAYESERADKQACKQSLFPTCILSLAETSMAGG